MPPYAAAPWPTIPAPPPPPPAYYQNYYDSPYPYYQQYYAPPRFGRPYSRRDDEPGAEGRERRAVENPADARRSPRSGTGANASAPTRDVITQPAPTPYQQAQEQDEFAATHPRAPAESVELPPAASAAKPEPSSPAVSGQQQH